MPHTGQLRERVTLQRETLTPDGAGGTISTWADVDIYWARVEPLRGGEQIEAQAVSNNAIYRVWLRHGPVVYEHDRFAWRDTLLNVRNTSNPDERRQWLQVLAEAGVAT